MSRNCVAFVFMICVATTGVAFAQGEKVFLGNLHSHTKYSDGSGTPEEAYKAARRAGLDFFAVTEHNHSRCEDGATADRRDDILIGRDHQLYNGTGQDSLISTANRLNDGGTFVTLYGQEFSSISKGNHINVFDVPEVIDDHDVPNGNFAALFNDWLPSHLASNGKQAVVQFNHPYFRHTDHFELEYGRDDFGSDDEWLRRVGDRARTLELLNGPGTVKDLPPGSPPEEVAEPQYLKFLNLGFHLAPTGDQDNHYKNWGTETTARTGIIADELTRTKLLAAIDARHVYATEDKNLKVIFRVNDHLCGDRLAAPEFGSELKIRFEIKDADQEEAQATYQVDVFSGTVRGGLAQVIETIRVEGNSDDGKIEDVRYTGGPQYVFFRITQILEGEEDGRHERAWTAPVWFDADLAASPPVVGNGTVTPPQPPAGRAAVPEGVANLVASRRSASYHLSLECLDAQRIKPQNLVRGAQAREGRTLHPGCPRKAQ